MPSRRAAILTPSPIRSPSLSSTTSPEMDADPKLDAALRRKASIALDHAVLHLNGAANGIYHATKFDDAPVAGALHDAPVMRGDGGIEQIAPQPAQPSQCPFLVGASKPAVSDHIRRKNGCEFPGLRHDTTLDVSQSSTISWFKRELMGDLKKALHSRLAGYQSSSDRPVTKA